MYIYIYIYIGFPCGSAIKNLLAMKETAWIAGDTSSIPGSGRSLGEGIGNLFQYSCLGNPTDRGAWWTTIHGVARVRRNLVTKQPPPPYIYV